MRISAPLACGLLLVSCGHMSVPSAIPLTTLTNANAVRPAQAWLCGQPPSARTRQGDVQPDVGSGYKSLYRFKAGSDGGYPYGQLINVNGKLYGTTTEGGANGYGTVFDMTTSGQEHVIYSFKSGKDGAYPCAGLANVGGKLYGTTSS